MEHKRARAQSLVEFALILPVLLLVIFTLIDVALVFQGYLTVSHAAREGMRFAIVYQPNQGECLHRDASGAAIPEPRPDCPLDYAESLTESDSDYYARRSLLIKRETMQAVRGLRTTTICAGADSAACITANNAEPGMVGVRIWGFQTFEAAEQLNMPGLQGLPVRVQVIHNVPLVVFGALLPSAHLQVRSAAGGINEGVQVGFGNQPPPTFGALPTPIPPGPVVPPNTPTVTPTPGPTPTPTPIPIYHIALDFETALNELPDDRVHQMAARVTDDRGRNMAGARVTFRTDLGSFNVAGVGMPSVIVSTDANGWARVTLYANRPGTSRVTAWLNYNNDGEVDPQEPVDTATKTWQATGPYLVVSDHNPKPNDWLGVSVMDHPPASGPFSLWWCPTAITSTQVITRLAFPINVNPTTWDLEDVAVRVPFGVAGSYRIESHSGNGGANACSQPGTRIAYSGIIEIAAVPPDLIIQNVTVVDQLYIRPGVPITLVITVTNQSPVAILSGPFDVDVYMPQDNAPQVRQMGLVKQWLPNLPPLGSFVLTTTVTVYTFDPQTLWVQVDTTNYINEGEAGGEGNNTYGPIVIQPRLCLPSRGREDNFDGGLGGQWTGLDLPTASHSVVSGQLRIMPNRGRIGGIGNTGTFDGGHYVYQSPVSGNFTITMRVMSLASTGAGAEAGLMVRESMDLNSRYFATLIKNNQVFQDYRITTGGAAAEAGATSISLALWVRIERLGNVFNSYSATSVTGPWTLRGSARTIAMGAVHVGIVATGDDYGIPGAALFDDFTILPATLTGRNDNFDSGLGAQWTGETLLRGAQSAGGTLAVTPGWGDIGKPTNYDSFRYLYQSPVSGNFSMTVQVLSLQSTDTDANAGLMVRGSLAPDAVHYSFLQTRGGAFSREFRATAGGSPTVNTNTTFNPPQYLRIARAGNVFTAYSSADGVNWTLRRTDTMANMPSSVHIGLATNADNSTVGPATYDNFTICTLFEGALPTPPTPPVIKPPGLVQCAELLSVAGFEGNPDTVFSLWKAGDLNGLPGAFQRTSAQFRRGSFSMRLHASNGTIPCESSRFQPYVYQTVTMPTEVYTFSTVIVSGYYYVQTSTLECSLGTIYDSGDVLSANLYPAAGGAALLPAQPIINGGSPSGTWYPVQLGLHTALGNPSTYAGQSLRMQWNGFNDADVNGTFFYLDDLSMQVCTTWPVPPDQINTASVGGLVRTRGQNNIPVLLPGADVWAYAQGGEILRTRAIHDGTYRFYNIPPGTYIIYAEAWMSGQLRTATTQVTVAANERNYDVNLLLQ